MEPATAALIARAAIAAGTNKKVWTGIASVLAALCLPVILAVMCYISIASGGTEHNRAAVHLAFDGGEAPDGMPADYQAYVRQMQESFAELDAILDDIDGMTGRGTVRRGIWYNPFLFSVFRRRPGTA